MRALLLALLLIVLGPASAESQPTGATASTPSVPTPVQALTPDTVLDPPGGPRIVLLGTQGRGVSALRLFVPLTESSLESGMGRVMADLAERRMEALARPVGARTRVVRTPRGLAYEAEGATADLEYLAYLLREGASRPDVSEIPFTRARTRAEERVARSREVPSERLARSLRSALDPGAQPLDGTRASLEALQPARILEVWQRSHRAPGMTLVVSAGVLPEVVLAATRGMGSADPTDPGQVYAPASDDTDGLATQTLRRWYGLGWAGGGGHPPVGPVTALLLAEVLPGVTGDFESSVRLVELSDRWGILLLGAAYPRRAQALRGSLNGALDALEGSLNATSVQQAVDRVRLDLLTGARTPRGLVEEVGWRMERSADPRAAATYLERLEGVDLDSVRAFLAELRAGGGTTGEVGP